MASRNSGHAGGHPWLWVLQFDNHRLTWTELRLTGKFMQHLKLYLITY